MSLFHTHAVYGPIQHIMAFAGVRGVGCGLAGCLPLSLTCKEYAREYARGQAACRPLLVGGLHRLCQEHCGARARGNLRTLLRYHGVSRDFEVRNAFSRHALWIHVSSRRHGVEDPAATRSRCAWLQQFFTVRGTCCNGKGFRPTGWDRRVVYRLEHAPPWWRTRVGRVRRRRALVTLLYWLVASRLLARLHRIRVVSPMRSLPE